MREIKLRGYSKDYKTMFDYNYIKKASDAMVKICQRFIDDNEIDSIPIATGLFIPTDDKDMVMMQYTGLKDKNGKEIYEGDIYHMGDKNIKYVVAWNDTGLTGKQLGSKSYAGLTYWQSEIEIIGNIYENKDLLEVSNE